MARASQTNPQSSNEGLTVIGADIRVNGKVSGEEDLRVEGRVEGSIKLTHTLYVDDGGIVVAEVEANDIVVSGVVVGNVRANNCITLHPGGRLVGDIVAPRVVIADGAAFRGNVSMGGEGSPPAVKTTAIGARRTSRAPVRMEGRMEGRAEGNPRGRSARAAASARVAAPAAEASAPASSPAGRRIAPIRPAVRSGEDEEVTVVVRHAEVATNDKSSGQPAKTKAKKAPPRARMPKPGKRRINRR